MQIGTFEIVGGALLFFVILVSRSVEFLGAELILPIAQISFDLDHRESIEVAAPGIWLAVLIKFTAAMWHKDKKYKDRRVLDFKFAVVIMPLCLIGAFWGEVLHATLASEIETLFFCIIVAILLIKSYIELIKTYRKYKKSQRKVRPTVLNDEVSTISDKMVSPTSIQDGVQEDSSPAQKAINPDAEDSDSEDSEELELSKYKERVEKRRQTVFEGIDDVENHPQFDKEYKPRYLKRLIPMIFMVAMLGKFSSY